MIFDFIKKLLNQNAFLLQMPALKTVRPKHFQKWNVFSILNNKHVSTILNSEKIRWKIRSSSALYKFSFEIWGVNRWELEREVSSSARKYVRTSRHYVISVGEERNRLRSSSKCTFFLTKTSCLFKKWPTRADVG